MRRTTGIGVTTLELDDEEEDLWWTTGIGDTTLELDDEEEDLWWTTGIGVTTLELDDAAEGRRWEGILTMRASEFLVRQTQPRPDPALSTDDADDSRWAWRRSTTALWPGWILTIFGRA